MKQKLKKVCSAVLFALMTLPILAQSGTGKKNITGTISDLDGIPLQGVNIIEKGTTNGVVSDFDGNYNISVTSGSTLTYSFIGMRTVERTVTDNITSININMEEDASSLEEVVLVGYAPARKRESVTSAIETIDPAEIEDLPVGDLSSALQGRILGVSVSGGQSRPGEGATLTIRQPLVGVSSALLAKDGGNSQPLFVIDGVVQIDPDTGYNDNTLFNNLDASEVESISFLKDAAAAVYGSRSSQGVVLVTTKRGRKGPAKFRYSGNVSIADETYRPEVMNAYDYGRTFNIMNGPNGNNRNEGDRNYFFTDNELEHFKTLDYNFLEEAWKSSTTQRHNFNVSGGSENATYFAGISFFDQDANLGILDFQKWSFRAGSTFDLAKGLSGDFQVSGFFNETNKTFNKFGSESEDDYIQLQYRAPFLPHYINGLATRFPGASGANQFDFNYQEIQRLSNLAQNNGNNVTLNASLSYQVPFIEGLAASFRYARTETKNRGTQIGYNFYLNEFTGATDEDDYIFYESGTGPLGTNEVSREYRTSRGARVLIDNTTSIREQTNFQLTYARDFGKNSFSGVFAIEKSESSYNLDRIIFEGNIEEGANGQAWEVGNRDASNTFTGADEAGDLGYIGRLSYDYDDKYFVDLVYRSDASTKFAPQNYWGNFYTLSAGWIVSKESFFNSNTFDFLKFRASIGKVGADQIKPWLWRQGYSYQNADSGKGPTFGDNSNVTDWWKVGAIPNFDARWSEEIKTNFGVEAKLLNNRLSFNIDQYYNMGSDMLVLTDNFVPFTVGNTAPTVNFGRADTFGTEISVSWNDTLGEDFRYGVTINTGFGSNKIIEGNFTPGNKKPWEAREGESSDLGVWGYDYAGMFRSYEEIDAYVARTGVTDIFGKVYDADPTQSDIRPGMLYYNDVRGEFDPETGTFGEKDGIITEDDQIQLRKPNNWVPTGFSSIFNFAYKNFSLNTVISTSWGGYNMVGNTATKSYNRDRIFQNWENRPAFWGNMFDPDLNPTGTIPNLANNNSSINNRPSEFWAVDNFVVNIRNINLNYSLPKNITEKLNVSSVKLNLVAINPFIITNPYSDYGLSPSGDFDSYPVLKTYSIGLNVGF